MNLNVNSHVAMAIAMDSASLNVLLLCLIFLLLLIHIRNYPHHLWAVFYSLYILIHIFLFLWFINSPSTGGFI